MRNTFTFKGINSADFGVWLEGQPQITGGAVRNETQTIIGSAKVLHYTEGDDAMDPVQISLDCAVGDVSDEDMTEIFAWLRGSGDLRTDYDPDHCYRGAFVVNQISMERMFRAMRGERFSVELECEAHRYHYPEALPIAMSAPGEIINPGTAPAEPLIRVNGSGDVELMIGTSTLLIDGLDGYAMIDCETQMIYKGDVNLGASVTRLGAWPVIPAEGCVINWTGSITDIEITPRWRDY